MLTAPEVARARAWLAEADPDEAHAHRWLTQTTIIMLPIGYKWAIIRAPETAGRAAIAAGITGPVICDHGICYFLVPRSTPHTWTPVRAVECLGDACWLTVPAPTRAAPPGPHWLIPPDGTGVLCDARALHASLLSELGHRTDER
ncbi:hypothetical protein AB0I22_13050 [Streptomyces sp. NPDC050610]|uniref:hypothetical protein n=1 Tax=Streptomyces sp. NPDC050610 TaxID=3157097 RepID=UPI0034289C07